MKNQSNQQLHDLTIRVETLLAAAKDNKTSIDAMRKELANHLVNTNKASK